MSLLRRRRTASSTAAAQLAHADPDELSLPEAVIVRILHHVPLSDRFESCALVCQQWAAAAAAATTEIDTVIADYVIEEYEDYDIDSNAGKCDSLCAWLKQHGAQVTSIKLKNLNCFDHSERCDDSCDDVLVVPCAKLSNLQRLVLRGFEVHLDTAAATVGAAGERAAAPDCLKHSAQDAQHGQRSRSSSINNKGCAATGAATAGACAAAGAVAAAGSAGATALLPRLQELKFTYCELAPGTAELLPLVPSLTKLRVLDSRPNEISTALPQLLQQLPALQDLQLICAGTPEHGLDPVTSLQHLQWLNLAVPYGQDLGVLARLPAGLTGLHLSTDPFDFESFGISMWVDLPVLQGLTALRHLVIQVSDWLLYFLS
jgi:hypothetical protein